MGKKGVKLINYKHNTSTYNTLGHDLADTYTLQVKVSVHGKRPHLEYYAFTHFQFDEAVAKGYIGKDKPYLDWKPIDGQKVGGIIPVTQWGSDDKYIYAETAHGRFSLPKYLAPQIPASHEILFGLRVKQPRHINKELN